jgi:hypothetical protein
MVKVVRKVRKVAQMKVWVEVMTSVGCYLLLVIEFLPSS